MSPALIPTSTPQLSPALALPLIVTLTVPSARTSLIPSTPPPMSKAAMRTEPAMPRWEELRTHSEISGSPFGSVCAPSHVPPAISVTAQRMPSRMLEPAPVVTITMTIATTSSNAPRYSAEVWPRVPRVRDRTAGQDALAMHRRPESRVLSWA